MKTNFQLDTLNLSVTRRVDGRIQLDISSDYSQSPHKSRLYVKGESLANEVEKLWKSVKTTKLTSMCVYFDEIDHYDDEVDVYTTPIINIRRGLKRAKITSSVHGSVPKDWSFNLECIFEDVKSNTSIISTINTILGTKFSPTIETEFKNELKKFLKKETTSVYVESEEEEPRSVNYARWY